MVPCCTMGGPPSSEIPAVWTHVSLCGPCCMVPCCMLHGTNVACCMLHRKMLRVACCLLHFWGGEPATRTLLHCGVGSLVHRKFPHFGLVSLYELFVRWYHWYHVAPWGGSLSSKISAVWTRFSLCGRCCMSCWMVPRCMLHGTIIKCCVLHVACCIFGVGSLLLVLLGPFCIVGWEPSTSEISALWTCLSV